MSQQSIKKKEILQSYRQQIEQHASSIQQLKKDKKLLALTRLVTVFGGTGTAWYAWPSARFVFFFIVLFTIIFIYLVFRDADKTEALKNLERLIRINQHELDAMQQTLRGYEDGQNFEDPVHAYAADLDLFGPSSLFQWLSRCHADQSKKLLGDYLKSPLTPNAIRDKQLAAKELAEKQPCCQQFQSLAMASPLSFNTEKRIKQWMTKPAGEFEKPYWISVRNIYPLLSVTILTIFILDYITTGFFLFWLIGFFAVSSFISVKINPVYELLARIQPEMDSLHEQLHLIEKESFHSRFLQSLKTRLKPAGYDSAASAMHVFHSILKKFDFRLNFVVFVVLNIFLLWDLRQKLALNEWKKKNRLLLNDWFDVVAEMEVTISLASLVHNEPEWCFPEVDENYFHFKAAEIGHPLIAAENRITNDFEMVGAGKIILITGSNMAGKSTFLRSLGINTVLAGMGAPVCARHLRLSEVKLISSMRVADNLAENTSTFYAELKKLQFIIESVNRGEQVFILLDEVLRGTNSTDRHKGSRALVRQLLQSRSVAVMATHDTELAHSESTADEAVSNYYFEGKIMQDELYFDYKIKKGICESLNATTLMKKIGIHFQE
jgi:MutS domain V